MITITIQEADRALYAHLHDLCSLPGKTDMTLEDNRLLIQCLDWEHEAKNVVEEAMTAFTDLSLTITSNDDR